MTRRPVPVRSVWLRLTALSVAVLTAALAGTVGFAWELALVQGRRDLDALLQRERDVLATSAPSLLGGLPATDRTRILDRSEGFLTAQPGSDRHLSRIDVPGAGTLTTSAGPAAVLTLRDRDALPAGVLGRLVTVDTAVGRLRVLSTPILVGGVAVGRYTVYGWLGGVERDAAVVAQRAGLAATGAGMVAVLVLGWAVRRATRPLRALHEAVDQAGLHDLTVRVPDPGPRGDEVADLARGFNRMLARLEQAVAAHSALFAAVSHELRTPVAVARGHVELVVSGAARDRDASLRLVDTELGRLSRLLDDLLLLASARHGSVIIRRPVERPWLVEAVTLRLAGLGYADVPVLLDGVADPAYVDADRLLQAVVNLVVNARVHTPSGTPVEVRIGGDDELLTITVSDGGPGVPTEIRDRVLEPFVTTGRDSTGLGLAVVKAVVDAHHGRLDILTRTTGTQVVLALPAAPDLVDS